jgi:hypothetical protein
METMTAAQAAEAAKGLTFETVWTALMESRESMKASQEETERQMRESRRLIEELSKQVSGVTGSLGQMTEAMLATKLHKKFRALGYDFERTTTRTKYFKNDRLLAEADAALENDEYIVLVEVKTKLTVEFVKDHLERIERIRGYMDERGDKRKILGAVATGVFTESVVNYAWKHGLFVVTQTGDTAELAEPPEGFTAREW